jgi:hypothetical protein
MTSWAENMECHGAPNGWRKKAIDATVGIRHVSDRLALLVSGPLGSKSSI